MLFETTRFMFILKPEKSILNIEHGAKHQTHLVLGMHGYLMTQVHVSVKKESCYGIKISSILVCQTKSRKFEMFRFYTVGLPISQLIKLSVSYPRSFKWNAGS